MPNAFAYAVLLGWPLVAIWIFRVQKSFERAIVWSVVGSFLFLPEFAIDLPGIPPLDKVTIPNLTLLLLVILTPKRPFRLLPVSPLGRLLLLVVIASPFLTAITNQDDQVIGGTLLRGLTLYDALSSVAQALLLMVPFLIGRSYLGSQEAQRDILKVLFAAGLVYSVLILFEVRMSPQLHQWVYGFTPYTWLQQIREGGYRPVVFLPHGLWTAFFAMTVTVAAAVLWREARAGPRVPRSPRGKPSERYLYATGYLGIVLVLCKSLSSLLYGIFLVPVVLLTRPRTQLWVAVVLMGISITYPATRGAGLIPIDTITSFARSISEQRADSLQVRLDNEERLLERASERPLFGWGSWGRNRVYDPETGRDTSITDGYWVIQIGVAGWVGYIGTLGLMALPVWASFRQVRTRGAIPNPITSGLSLLLAINMIEILPNSTFPPWTWLIAGALLGYAEQTSRQKDTKHKDRVSKHKKQRTIL